MTTQLLIIKIQSLLGGTSNSSEAQKRSLASEYSRRCAEATDLLERAVAQIKAGREYPALQIAESRGLLEMLGELLFPNVEKWRDFCVSEDLPVPPPFDDSQIELLQSLYSKGITQAHPLYRDYRRAMRKRDYEGALAVIRTISKINTYDAEPAREVAKLRRRVAKKRLTELDRLLSSGACDADILNLCAELEPDIDFIGHSTVWERACEFRKDANKRYALVKCTEIISKLKTLNPTEDWEECMTLLSDLNMYSDTAELSQADLDIIEDYARRSAKSHSDKLAAERANKARNELAIEIEQPSSISISEKLRKLIALRNDAGDTIDVELERKYLKATRSLKRALKIRRAIVSICTIAAAGVVSVGVWKAYEVSQKRAELASVDAELARIGSYSIPEDRKKRLDEFVAKNPTYSKMPSFADRIAKLRESANLEIAQFDRIQKKISSFEKLDISKQKPSFFANAKMEISALDAEIAHLPAAKRILLKDKLDAISSSIRKAGDEMKSKMSLSLNEGLAQYEKLLEAYTAFKESSKDLKAREDVLIRKLRPLMEETSSGFRAHEIDIAKFNELSVQVSAARSKYEKFEMLKEGILLARSYDDYISAAEIMLADSVAPASFARKLSKIYSVRNIIAMGQSIDFASSDAVAAVADALTEVNGELPESKALTSIYAYRSESGQKIYTIEPIAERTQKWQGGYTTVQEAKEISLGGNISTTRYMKSATNGSRANGELLTGGNITPESRLGAEIVKIASNKSLLEAASAIANSTVNPIFKAYFERVIFELARKNPIKSGYAYSLSAQKRANDIMKETAGFFDYSWLFVKDSKLRYIKSSLYGKQISSFINEAKKTINAVKISKEAPLDFIGIRLEDGKVLMFKDKIGALRAVRSDGTFGVIKNVSEAAELSPIFTEVMSSAEILEKASK